MLQVTLWYWYTQGKTIISSYNPFTENVEAADDSLPHIFDLAFSLRIWSDRMVEGPDISTDIALVETLVSVMFFVVALEVNLFFADTETI